MSIRPSGDPEYLPEDRLAQRMARIDGCPECVANYEPPQMVRPAVDGFRADYRCTYCRHEWTTWWSDEQPDWMM